MTGYPEDVTLALVAAREAWPALAVPDAVFAEFLETREVNLRNVTSAVAQDLYLACACLHGVFGALGAFSQKFSPTIKAIAHRFNSSPSFGDDVEQQLNEVLFVGGSEGRARIGRYSGAGALLGFVSTAARRVALRQARTRPTFQGEEELVEQFAEVRDQEMDLLKVRYRETFNKALPIALRQLPRRDRLILRMNVVERVSTTKIASIYKVSQPTVSRWIQSAAIRIFAVVKELVCEELDIDTKEMESLLTLVRSQIDLTLSHAVGDTSTISPR
jgi:RNA polymerase sigma-70 factor (ECF subfamily)